MEEFGAPASAATFCLQTSASYPAVFVDWFGDPLDARVSSESFMEWSNEDDLKEFLCRLFSKPGGIQDPQGPMVVSGMLLTTD